MTKLKKSLGLLIGLLLVSFGTFAQISGPTTGYAGSTYSYTYDDGIAYKQGHWTVTNGTIISSSLSGTTYTGNIQWTAAGAGTVNFVWASGTLATLNVTVIAAC